MAEQSSKKTAVTALLRYSPSETVSQILEGYGFAVLRRLGRSVGGMSEKVLDVISLEKRRNPLGLHRIWPQTDLLASHISLPL